MICIPLAGDGYSAATPEQRASAGGSYRRGLVFESELPTREGRILSLFRSTQAYRRMSKEKRIQTLISASFWADEQHRGFW